MNAQSFRPRWSWSTRTELRYAAELLGATSMVIAQPILGVFGNNAAAFITVRAGALDIVAFALVVVFLPPLALWLGEQAVDVFGEVVRRRVHLGFLAVLAAVFIVRLADGSVGRGVALLVAVPFAAAVAVVLARVPSVGSFLRYLALSPVLFLLLFLVFSPVRRVAFGSEPELATPSHAGELPPIVMIVLDELPLVSLLDGDGGIDEDAFPGIGGLARNATLAINNTSVSPTTPEAIPALLTGMMPTDQAALATSTDHPRSLFTLLGEEYDLHVGEHVTELCPPSRCESLPGVRDAMPSPLSALLHEVPSVFRGSDVSFDLGIRGVEPHVRFDGLRRSLDDDPGGRPALHYLHSMLPHQNWVRLPDGTRYDAPNPPVGTEGSLVSEDPAHARVARQRHLLQVAYADRMVGQVLDDLRETGRYDDALIVLTSDHGVSFRPGESLRPMSEGNLADILWTPLLVKAPGQTDPEVIDSPTSAIDVLPTIVELLDLDVDWDLDGRSIFGQPRPSDWSPRALGWEQDQLEPSDDGFVHVDGVARFAEVRDVRSFDFGPEWDLRPWRWGRYGHLVGLQVASLGDVDAARVRAIVDRPERFSDVDPTAARVPVYVSGWVPGDEPVQVTVTVNGVVGGWFDATTAAPDDRGRRFDVVVPPSLLRAGDNEIEVFRIDRLDSLPDPARARDD